MKKTVLMRSFLFAAIALGLVVLPACDMPKPARPLVEAGEKVSGMTLLNPDGSETDISEIIEGKVALVDVWATWCAPCIAAMPHLQALHNRYKDRGFTVVGIMTDHNAMSRVDFLEKKKATYPMLIDEGGESFMQNWGQIAGVPLLVLVDRDGTVLETYRGTSDLGAIDKRLEEVFVGTAEADAEGEADASASKEEPASA